MRAKLLGIIASALMMFGTGLAAFASANIDPGFGFVPITGLTGGTVVLSSTQLQNGHLDLQGTLTSNLILQVPAGYLGEWSMSNSLVCTKFTAQIQYSGQSTQSSPILPCFGQVMRIWATGTTIIAPPTSVFGGANILHNGDFLIDQNFEGTAPTIATGTPGRSLDRWWTTFTTSTSSAGNPVVGQAALSTGLTGVPKELIWTSNATPSTTQPAGLIGIVYQTVEGSDMGDLGWGTATGLPATIGVWLKTSAVSANIGVFVQNTGSAVSFVHNCLTSATTLTWTYCAFQIPAPSSGTFTGLIGSTGLIVGVTAACGSTFQTTTADVWATGNFNCTSAQTLVTAVASGTLEMAMSKLERGTQATSFNPDPITVAMVKAQRFYRKTFNAGTAVAQNAGLIGAFCQTSQAAQAVTAQFTFSPPMFATPATVTTFNPSASNSSWRDVTGSADLTATVDTSTAKGAGGVEVTSATAAAAAHNVCIQATFDTGK